jgi:choline dehydrogenase-like flavoprotein
VQVIRPPKVYDAIVIGSGAGGGTAAQRLTDAGLEVVLLEAGPKLDPARDYAEHKWPYDYSDHGRTMNRHLGGRRIPGEPYVVADGDEFVWMRARTLGGRTNNWGRHSYRMAEWDFRTHDEFGMGVNWPVTYDDLEPYYTEAEKFLGVSGTREGLPSLPDGHYLPRMNPKCHEAILTSGARKLGIPMIPVRRALLTQNHGEHPACHWCGQCDRGCATGSKYGSIHWSIEPALKSGNLTLLTDSMAREITVDGAGRADGISYVDRRTGSEIEVKAKHIFVAGGTLETTRLLLNSKSRLHPNGLGGSSGELGRNLTDTVGTGNTVGILPQLVNRERFNEDGIHSGHVMVPWWKYDRSKYKLDYAGGYHMEVYGGFSMPSMAFARDVNNYFPGYGSSLKRSAREHFGAIVGIKCTGESYPNPRSFVEIDPAVVDDWGVPVLRIHFEWSENDYKMAEDMRVELARIVDASGGTLLENPDHRRRRAGMIAGGSHIHELGTSRMGRNPKTSVTNQFGQVWDSPNVSLIDGSVFCTNPDKNPTLTLIALAMRACDKVLDEG